MFSYGGASAPANFGGGSGGGGAGGGGGYNARHQQQVSSKFEAFGVTVKVENVAGEEGDPFVILIPFWPICIHDRTLFVGSL